jgi:hypothetical protein
MNLRASRSVHGSPADDRLSLRPGSDQPCLAQGSTSLFSVSDGLIHELFHLVNAE